MCRRTTCKSCGKPTWAGCGAHVEQVLGDVPKAQRCSCRETGRPAATNRSNDRTDAVAEPTTSVGRFRAWLRQ